MSIETELCLGNGYEIAVTIEITDFEEGYPARLGCHPDLCEPGESSYICFGKITSSEDVEEVGLKKGQEIDEAFIEGGPETLRKMEDEIVWRLDAPGGRDLW